MKIEGVCSPKRIVSTLVPYKKSRGTFLFFLQERDENSERLPGRIGLFGGGLEGEETPEEGMLREIKEELVFVPDGYKFFNRYEFLRSVNNVFIMEVGEDFEGRVMVMEGKSGMFLSSDEILKEPRIIDTDKLKLNQINEYLLQGGPGKFTW